LFMWISVYMWLWTLSLFWIDLENKWTLALIAWLMEFIPYLWPILGALPALLVGILWYGFGGFIAVGILFIIIQQIEWWIVPIIMNKALWVSPLMIIIMMLVWMKVMWFVWIILAIPLAVIISLLFEDSLGDNNSK
jgi:predicted PurR-regulated permease PerM